jgi:hypothetical protein
MLPKFSILSCEMQNYNNLALIYVSLIDNNYCY